jgi:hypothetical protein
MNLINDQWSKERGDKFRKYFLTHRPFLNRNKIALTVQKWPDSKRDEWPVWCIFCKQ